MSKRFLIGTWRHHETLRDVLTGLFRKPPPEVGAATSAQEFWALRDVTFDVRAGDVVGIIGRNGAGKSTLLKILSRITEPTTGRVELRGRLTSLLEVGAGFHPELTGRENVFLNGAILGMSRREIRDKFDEIVEFAEIPRFIDTPVKRYSSGMYLRLAFAVSAHLDPDIQIVDEVLAVGDAAFQQKCINKLNQDAASGKTLLFVSHTLPMLQRLCTRGIYLAGGRIEFDGAMTEAMSRYQRDLAVEEAERPLRPELRESGVPPGQARFVNWGVAARSEQSRHACRARERAQLSFRLVSRTRIDDAYFGLAIWSPGGDLICGLSSRDSGGGTLRVEPGEFDMSFALRLPLRPGHYQLDVSLTSLSGGLLDRWAAVPLLQIESAPGQEPTLPVAWQGLLNERADFSLEPRPAMTAARALP